jgi:hypothetical protein
MISNPPQRAHNISCTSTPAVMACSSSIAAELPFLALSEANLVPFAAGVGSSRHTLELPTKIRPGLVGPPRREVTRTVKGHEKQRTIERQKRMRTQKGF